MKRTLQRILPVLVLAGCGSDPSVDDPMTGPSEPLKVMTWNLYLGTDFESLFTVSTLDEVPNATAAAWAAIQDTDFADRAQAIADRVALEEPHLIGLQEVELYRIQSPSDGWTGAAATDVAIDFLDVLQAALEERGLDYSVAVSMENVDVEAPMAAGGGEDDIRITDRDVILARSDVSFDTPEQHHFESATSYPLAGTPIAISVPKAWVAVQAMVGGQRILFVNTHLEIATSPPTVQDEQAAELVQALEAVTLPTVLVGDLNAAPGETAYQGFLDAGFEDAWVLAGQAEEPTCCQAADLRNQTSTLSSRIDHVLLRGSFDVSEAERLGATAAERSAGGRWPSDHAGVVVTIP